MIIIKKVLLVSIIATFGLVACDKEDIDLAKQAEFNKPYTLSFNEMAYHSNNQNRLRVEIKNITDLRCADDACQDEGMATVRLNLSNLKNATSEIMLSISPSNPMDSAVVNVNDIMYKVKLLQVTSGFQTNPPTNPVATLQITPVAANDKIRLPETEANKKQKLI
jgi:hypothetical protein